MYAFVLLLHSWLRWIVVCAALWVVALAVSALRDERAWSASDQRARDAFLGLLRTQFLLGLALYLGLSPIVRAAWHDFGSAMRSAPLRFFSVEHITAMLAAIAVAEIGAGRVRRATTDRARHKNALGASLGFLVLAATGIPWPGLKHARPLFRTALGESDTSMARPATTETPAVYGSRCAVCHGVSGDGHGVAAPAMQPPPRDFRDAAWQRSVSDDELRSVISQGGSARELSTSMPAHPDLKQTQVDELIRFIRSAALPEPR